MLDTIKNIAEIVSALTIIVSAFFAIEKFTKGKITKWLQKPVMEKIEKLNSRMDKFEVVQLKNIIMNDNIPISERLEAGDRYIHLGGNGAIKVFYKKLKDDYYEQLEKEERNKEEVI